MKVLKILILSLFFVSCNTETNLIPNEPNYPNELKILGSWWHQKNYIEDNDTCIEYEDYYSIVKFYEDGIGCWYMGELAINFNWTINDNILLIKCAETEKIYIFTIKKIDVFDMIIYHNKTMLYFKNVTTRC